LWFFPISKGVNRVDCFLDGLKEGRLTKTLDGLYSSGFYFEDHQDISDCAFNK
jgi:hypothetical protein